ncbi:MAG: oligosaccharide flippase family protein [Phycisphaerae bacterium]
MAWGITATISYKLVNVVGQVVLAWLLQPEDFGLINLALSITMFGTMMQGNSVREVLVQRQHQFKRWANPAFWMSLTMGLVTMLILTAMAPIAAWVYGDKRVIGLILVVAASIPITSLSLIPRVKLEKSLNFKTWSLISVAEFMGNVVLSIVLALLKFGPYSYVLPLLLVPIVKLVVIMPLTHTKLPHLRLDLHRWRHLFKDNGLSLLALFLLTVILQGDNVILGMLQPAVVVGIYAFAFSHSMQTIAFLSNSLGLVLFPTLTKLQGDRPRQLSAFLRATDTIAMLSVPICFVQAVVIDSLIRIFFQPKWYGAITLAQILSVGMAVRTITWPASSLLQAQGRWLQRVLILAGTAPIFLGAVALGAWQYGGPGAAFAEAAFFLLVDPIWIVVAVRGSGGTLRDVARLILRPLLLGLGVSLLGLAAGYFLPDLLITALRHSFSPKLIADLSARLPRLCNRDAARLACVLVVAGAAHLVGLRMIGGETWAHVIALIQRARGLLLPTRVAADPGVYRENLSG